MEEPHDVSLARDVEEHLRAEDVRPEERQPLLDRPVHVGLGGEVDDDVRALGRVERPAHVVRIRDVALHEGVVHPREVLEIPSVREFVEDDDGAGLGEDADEVRADEPRAARHKDALHERNLLSASRQGASRLPRISASLLQSSALIAGRFAGRGNSAVVHGVTFGPRSPLISRTASASSYQVHAPSQAAW